MKKMMILAILLLVGAIVAPLFMKDKDGNPIMTVDELLPTMPDVDLGDASGSDQQEFYRYQDANGNWVYTDKPPMDDPTVESVQVDTSANNMDAVKPRASNSSSPSADVPAVGVAGLAQAADIVEDAKNVQQLMDDREGKLDQQIDNSN